MKLNPTGVKDRQFLPAKTFLHAAFAANAGWPDGRLIGPSRRHAAIRALVGNCEAKWRLPGNR